MIIFPSSKCLILQPVHRIEPNQNNDSRIQLTIFLTQNYHKTSEDLKYSTQVIRTTFIQIFGDFLVIFGAQQLSRDVVHEKDLDKFPFFVPQKNSRFKNNMTVSK